MDTMQFYPTPEDLALKMASYIGEYDQTFLEPSAGDGALVAAIGSALHTRDIADHWRSHSAYDVDCIEISDIHRAVIKQNFSDERARELHDKAISLKWDNPERRALDNQVSLLESINVRIIYDDFLEFETYKRYDCIMMNPPFMNADIHILKAIEMQQASGGRVIALCNAETLRNPYTRTRKALVEILDKHSADIEYIEHAFIDAERETEVEVALIHVCFDRPASSSFIIEGLEKARAEQEQAYETTAVSAGEGYIDQMIEQYNFETRAVISLINEYRAMKPYILNTHESEAYSKRYSEPIVQLKLLGKEDCNINAVIKEIRKKYWKALFHKPEFTDKMTSDLAEEYRSSVDEMADYDFNDYNINQVLERMYVRLNTAYKDSVTKVFDKLSCLHSYSGQPEETNIHYFNGWKTNKSWKVGEKNIIPCYAYTTWSWDAGKFDAREAYCELSDIVKVLDYLDNDQSIPNGSDLSYLNALNNSCETLRNVHLKYFDVSFFKKGTCHIKWTNHEVLEKLNIVGSQLRGWLPPGYGKKKYEDMSKEEQEIIDDFQSREGYEKVLQNADYYLSDQGPMMIECGTSREENDSVSGAA